MNVTGSSQAAQVLAVSGIRGVNASLRVMGQGYIDLLQVAKSIGELQSPAQTAPPAHSGRGQAVDVSA